jgi:hypothetical protein
MIVSARPTMKPLRTGSEMNEARKPIRASPAPMPTRPVTTASAAVSATYRSLPPSARSPTMPADSAAVADMDATTRCREDPTSA